jgi:hypothetical protein
MRLVRNIVTGDSRGYAFVEFTHEKSCQEAYRVSYVEINVSFKCLNGYMYVFLI